MYDLCSARVELVQLDADGQQDEVDRNDAGDEGESHWVTAEADRGKVGINVRMHGQWLLLPPHNSLNPCEIPRRILENLLEKILNICDVELIRGQGKVTCIACWALTSAM